MNPDPDLCLALLDEWDRVAVTSMAGKLGVEWQDTPLLQVVEALAVESMASELQAQHGSWERGQARREAAVLLRAGPHAARVAERVRKRLERWRSDRLSDASVA